MANIKLIHEVHDMWPATLIEIGGMSKNNPFIRLLQRAENSAYKRSDLVVSIPAYTKQYMEKHGLASDKFVHIPNGIALDDWKKPKELPKDIKIKLEQLQSQEKFIVGYFGGHALSNALDILLDCAKELLSCKELFFVLVGKGVEKEHLKGRCKKEKLENVIFFDAVEKRCIPNLLKFFDCIYMGTMKSDLYRFGLGLNKFYDAMMSEKPIVLSATAPMTIIEKYKCGIVVPAQNINAICDAIKNIYGMTETQRGQMGKNGKKAVLENFTYDKLAEDFDKKMFLGKKKNILLINHYVGSPKMGMEFRPYYFAKEWVKKGYHVDIIAADYSHLRIKNPHIHHDFEEQVIDGIHYHWIHTSKYEGNGLKRAMTMFQFVGKLWINAKKIARQFKPDVIITSSTYPLDTYVGQRIKKKG